MSITRDPIGNSFLPRATVFLGLKDSCTILSGHDPVENMFLWKFYF